MLGEAIRKHKLDTRLQRRRGWIEPEELSQAIGELPDVADKAADEDEDDGSEPGG